MWAMTRQDRADLEAYRALGSVDEIRERLTGPLPDDEDRAPLPYSDPAQEAADGYGDGWDYPGEEQLRRHSGLLGDEA